MFAGYIFASRCRFDQFAGPTSFYEPVIHLLIKITRKNELDEGKK